MAIIHTYITKDGHKTENLTRGRAIRQKCLECCGWIRPEVRKCTSKDCALYPFRMGSLKYAQKIDSER